jgi:hypothetical protein
MAKDPHISKDWALIILKAALPQTYPAMSIFTKSMILQSAFASNNPKVAKQLLSSLSQKSIIKLFLNSYYIDFTELFKLVPQQGEVIGVLWEHFPAERAAEISDYSLRFFVYAALVRKETAQLNKLIPFLPPLKRKIILPEVAQTIRDHVQDAELRNNANIIILSFIAAEDVIDVWDSENLLSWQGLIALTEEAIKQGRSDLVNAVMYQILVGAMYRDYFKDTIKHAALYGQIDILMTALACYEYPGEVVPNFVKELATKKEFSDEVRSKLNDYLEPSSPFRQAIEQIKLLMKHGISLNEAFTTIETAARVQEAQIALGALTEKNQTGGILLIGDVAEIVADYLYPKGPGSSPSLSSSTTTVSQSTAGGTISWAEDEDIAAISHVKDDHKARKARPKTSWQQRYEDSRSATHSTSSSQVSSNQTHSERVAARRKQNVVTEFVSSTGTSEDGGRLVKLANKVSPSSASFLDR